LQKEPLFEFLRSNEKFIALLITIPDNSSK